MIVLPHSNQLFARNGPEQTNGWKSCQKIDGSEELETRPLGGGEGGSSSYFVSRYWIHPRTFISRLLIYLYSDIFLHSLSLDIFGTCVLFASDNKSYGYLDIFLFSE